MDNVLETNGVPLTVFGGAVPELAPEDLPEGASPFNQDVDYNPGSVFTRGGRANQIFYSNLFIEKICQVCVSAADPGSSNEVAWNNPGNARLNTPGTYASVSLNFAGGGVVGVPQLDQVQSYNVPSPGVTSQLFGPITPSLPAEVGFIAYGGGPFLTTPNFAVQDAPANVQFLGTSLVSPPSTINSTWTLNGAQSIVALLVSFFTDGVLPTVFNGNKNNSGSLATTVNINMVHPTTAGKVVVVMQATLGQVNWAPPEAPSFGTVTDNGPIPGTYTFIGGVNFTGTGRRGVAMWVCNNSSGATTITWTSSSGTYVTSGSTLSAVEYSDIIGPTVTLARSQELQGSNFSFNIPAGSTVIGFQVEVSGNQSDQSGSSTIVASVANPTGSAFTASGMLPASDGTIFLGAPTTGWNLPLSPGLLNPSTFTVQVQAQTAGGTIATFNIYALKVKVFLAPIPANFNWFKTYEQTNAQIDTLALDSNGILYDESVNYGSGPGVLNSIFLNIFANTYAKGVTFADIEYIAFSNLLNGTDIPRQWNGTNFDRISMVGPGQAPGIGSSGGAGGSTTAVQSITQAPQVQIRRIAWGASINAQNDSTPGNTLVVSIPGGSTHGGNQPLNMNVGDTVVLSSIANPFPKKGGGFIPFNINGTYKLLSSGTPIIGGGETDTAFTVQAPGVAYGYSNDFGSPPTSGWFYQDTVAMITLQSPLPNVGVGNSIQIASSGGGPPSGYDGTWTVLSAPNTTVMNITSAQVTGGNAQFGFTVTAGPQPTQNQTVTITNCLNGSGIGDLNVFNKTSAIQSVGGGYFSISVGGPDIPIQLQGGSPAATAVINGNVFTFDPGQVVTGYPGGGTIVSAGLIASGTRKVCYCFLTRSGYITQPSPISPLNVTVGSGSITVNNLATGPPNVVARIVCFTGANGGNFFYIPQTVNVTIPGQPVQINTSTIVNDNTSTQATFSFSDAVLLSATAIDIPGNNLFNTIELGSSRGLMTYSSRMFAWGEQNKITNLRNLSFDGGTLPGNSNPLGWTLDPTNGTGGSLNTASPVFGWAYQISNTSGSTKAVWGMLTQPAYQDEFGVPIVQASTTYSVRITASVNPVPVSGNLVVDLIDGSNGVVKGQFVLPLASMSTTMQLFTGTLLTTILQPVPPQLYIRIWAQNILTNTTILIDRMEPFPTLVPSFSTALKASYVNNQEAFDLLTGVCGPAQNQQPINGAMELFDLLYALKEKSWFSTFDNGVTEPNKWNWKEVSNKVGCIGINAFDWGEGWALTADREGVHFFEGGEPIKVSQEIQPLWDLINWQYGYTMWLRNDPEQRRFMVGVPIPTPQQAFLPEFPVNANPTSPNVVLMCNYRELNTGAALAATGPIRSTYTGRLMSPEPARKWSFWNIASPYSDYISRANNQWPQWFGSGYLDNKIFQLLQSQLSDDGQAVNSFWVSYGFVKPEMQDAKGLGLYRMEFPYFTVLATGLGTLNTMVYPESPLNRPYILDPLPLPSISQGDLEIGVNIKGNRFFIRVGTNAVGASFRVSKFVVPLIQDSWSPVRGYNAVTA